MNWAHNIRANNFLYRDETCSRSKARCTAQQGRSTSSYENLGNEHHSLAPAFDCQQYSLLCWATWASL